MSKPICEKCGGTIHRTHCLLCEMFETSAVAASSQSAAGWPIHSEALAAPTLAMVERYKEKARKHGVPTDYDSEGRAVITSRRHFKKLAAIHGFVHKGEV